MTDTNELESRVTALEHEVAAMKRASAESRAPTEWLDLVSGSMRDFPEFDEVVALGRAARRADQPREAAPDAA